MSTIADVFDCTNLAKFEKAIVTILDNNGMSGSILCMCEAARVRFLTKVCFYIKSPVELFSKTTSSSPTEAEIRILEVLKRDFIDKNATPCILELVYVQICDDLLSLAPPDNTCDKLVNAGTATGISEAFCTVAAKVRIGLAHNKCAFLVLERCDITMYEFVTKSTPNPVFDTIMKSLIFMVIFTLRVITKKYPGFKHNDLHSENLMLLFDPTFKYDPASPKYLAFHADKIYYLPYFGIIVKIIDFNFSTIPELGIVSAESADPRIVFSRGSNDVIYMLYWINREFESSRRDYSNIKSLFNELDPLRSYEVRDPAYVARHSKTILSYDDMLKCNGFAEYTIAPPKDSIYSSFDPVE